MSRRFPPPRLARSAPKRDARPVGTTEGETDLLQSVSRPARVADAAEGIGLDELALAARNHGMPLEALRYDVTPPGLHYLLIHYDIPALTTETWTLTIDGQVRDPLTLTLPDLRALPPTTVRVTMECAGNGRARLTPRPVSQPWLVEAVGTADWTGVPLRRVLDEADIAPDTAEIVFTGADHGVERGVEQDYQRSLPLSEALRDEVLLAYEMNGAPLPPQHGFPLRLVVPGWYGMAHVKWLTHIEATVDPFTGFQQTVAYRLRQEPGETGTPIQRIEPRALLIPPGFPDFMSRIRVVAPGPVKLSGRAWCGRTPLSGVELSADGGETWFPADLEPQADYPWAWRRFTATWTATPGRRVLTARALTDAGDAQPTSAPWNRGGFANNAAQEIEVFCG